MASTDALDKGTAMVSNIRFSASHKGSASEAVGGPSCAFRASALVSGKVSQNVLGNVRKT